MRKKIAVIGGVATGPKAASRARRRDSDAEITIVERGGLISYAGCGIPFYIEGLIEDVKELTCTPLGVNRDKNYFKRVKDVDVYTYTEALKIDRAKKKVTVKEVKTGQLRDIPYDKLVLAMGASPIVPKIEGRDLDGVHKLYNPIDAESIRKKVESGVDKVAIIGGGLIGMEICGAFINWGCKVTVFELMDQLLPGLLDHEMALFLEKHLRSNNVEVRTRAKVERLEDDGTGHVCGVKTADGEFHGYDMAVLSVGVRPNVDLARDSGLKIGDTGAIAVNEYLQTSDPDIYAGGDCVENTCIITGKKVYAPLGSTANKHGRVIGDNVTGGSTTFPGIARTTAFRVLNLNVGKTGLNEREAKAAGYDLVTSVAPREDCSHYYPSARQFVLKLVADRRTGMVLGGQAIGRGDAIKRIDVLATALAFRASVKEVADLDLGYAPPYSTAIDAVAHAANIVRNKIDGLARGISAPEFEAKLRSHDEFVMLDVRAKEEADVQSFNDPRTQLIPLDELRGRINEIPREKEIIALCRTSVRAYEAQRLLSNKGFSNVKFLDGSLEAWPYSLKLRP